VFLSGRCDSARYSTNTFARQELLYGVCTGIIERLNAGSGPSVIQKT